MSEFVPRPYQRIAGRFMLSHPRCALWLGCGLGKTSTTLVALQWLIETGRVKRAIVFAPLRVAQTSWVDEASKWDNIHISVASCTGTPKQRRAALAKDTNVLCTNYEQAEWVYENAEVAFDAVVIDEATRIKSYRPRGGGKWAKFIAKFCRNASYVYELTGTPSSRSLEDLYGQIAMLDGGERLGASMTAFHEKYFRPIRVGRDAYCVRWEPFTGSDKAIQERLRDIVCSIRTEDWFPVDEPLYVTRKVSLPAEARKLYKRMEDEMFVQIDDVEVEAVSAASRCVKCQQIADGFLYDSDSYVPVHDRKIEALQSIIEEMNGEPVCVCYWFEADRQRLLGAFPKAQVLTKDTRVIDAWNKGKIPLLLIQPASAGHGLNLQDGGRIMVFYGHGWSLELRDQAIERLGPTRQMQSGHPRTVYIYDLIAEHTIDELVMERYATKKSVQDTLLDALKRREENAAR